MKQWWREWAPAAAAGTIIAICSGLIWIGVLGPKRTEAQVTHNMGAGWQMIAQQGAIQIFRHHPSGTCIAASYQGGVIELAPRACQP